MASNSATDAGEVTGHQTTTTKTETSEGQADSDNGRLNNKRNRVNGKVLAELKRKKWEAKQQKQAKQMAKASGVVQTNHQIQNDNNNNNANDPSWCIHLSQQDVDQLLLLSNQDNDDDTINNASSPVLELLKPYCNLKTEGMTTTTTRCEGMDDNINNNNNGSRVFIAESSEAVRLLLKHAQEQSITVLSILTKPSVFYEKPVYLLEAVDEYYRKQQQQDTHHHNDFKVLVAPTPSLLTQIVGYPVQRGCLACGILPPSSLYTEEWLENLCSDNATDTTTIIDPHHDDKQQHTRLRLLALDGICDTANMGSILRTAACFGIHAVLLSSDCCNPWYRRSIRVSMGHVFGLKLVRVTNLATTLQRLAGATKVRTYAAVLDKDDATQRLDQIIFNSDKTTSITSSSWCCVLGNEGNGISKAVVDACTDKVQIDMMDGIDSLNVSVAAGILLHGFVLASAEKKNKQKGV